MCWPLKPHGMLSDPTKLIPPQNVASRRLVFPVCMLACRCMFMVCRGSVLATCRATRIGLTRSKYTNHADQRNSQQHGSRVDGRHSLTAQRTMTPPKKYPKSVRRKDALRVVARLHAGVNLKRPNEYWDDTLTVTWGQQDKYEVIEQVGKGKYGEVYKSINKETNKLCAVKIMRPVKEHRLRREIKILKHVAGGPNIINLHEVVRDPETKTPCFAFELVEAIPFKELQAVITDGDIRNYIAQLLQALDYCHSRGIMHRDVKVRVVSATSSLSVQLNEYASRVELDK